MPEIKPNTIKERTERIDGKHLFYFKCESDSDGVLRDTEVSLNGQKFCWISYDHIDGFLREFEMFLNKYKI